MQAISLEQARNDLSGVVERILKDLEPTIVITESGDSVVMLPLAEFNAWRETMYLLSTPANTAHLLRSIAEDQAGYAAAQTLDDA